MKTSTKVGFAALCSVPFVMVLSNSMLIPVLPAMQKAMDISLVQVGLIISAFSIPAGLVIPVGGYLSDKVGRKSVMVPALFIFGLGGLLAGLAPVFLPRPFMPILAGRVLQGVGAGGTYQVAMSMTGDIFQSEERSKALGLLEASNGFGKLISPLIGAATGLVTWFAPFFVYPLLSWLSAGSVWWKSEEPKNIRKKSLDRKDYVKNLKRIAKQKGVSLGANFLAGFVILFALFGLLSYYSDSLEKTFNIVGFVKGLVIAIPVAILAITSYLTGTVAQKSLARVVKPAATSGLLLIAAGLASLLFFDGLVPLSAGIAGVGFGGGILLPSINTMITSAAEWQERGLITAFYGSVRFFGAALGPPAFGLLVDLGKAPMFLGTMSLALVSAVLLFMFVDADKLLPEQLTSGKGKRQEESKVRWDARVARDMAVGESGRPGKLPAAAAKAGEQGGVGTGGRGLLVDAVRLWHNMKTRMRG